MALYFQGVLTVVMLIGWLGFIAEDSDKRLKEIMGTVALGSLGGIAILTLI